MKFSCILTLNSGLFIFLAVFVCLTAGTQHVIRNTKYGDIRGFVSTIYSGKRIEKYLGIPYASPPVGKLRFEKPVTPEPWENVYNALEIPPACPQPEEGVSYIEYHVPGFNSTSEDCLYLNIYTPKESGKRQLPVLFYVHGGSYYNGMGAMFDGSALAATGIVVVTANYRLGPLGFLVSGDSHLPGNYGMLDIIAALWWVRENIGVFNGDPEQMTVVGHSAGSCSVGFLMVSPLTKGLFRRVVLQSGSPVGHWSYSKKISGPDVHFKIFVSSIGCLRNSSYEIKRCLQKIPTEQMHRHISFRYVTSPSLSPQFRPVVDGYFLPDDPERLIRYGNLNVESVMTGATQDEGLIAALPLIKIFGGKEKGIKQLITLMYCFRGDLPDLSNIVDIVLDQYATWPLKNSEEIVEDTFADIMFAPVIQRLMMRGLSDPDDIVGDYYITAPTHKLAQILSLRNVSVYLYNYEYKSVLEQWKGVIHGSEIFYLSGFPMTGHPNSRYDESDKKMSKLLIHLWSNFISNGLPSLVPHRDFHMDQYHVRNPLYTKIYKGINRPFIETSSNYKAQKLDFWNRRIPTISQQCKSDDKEKSPGHAKKNYIVTKPDQWALIATCIGLAGLVMFFSVGYCKTRIQLQNIQRQHSVCITNDISRKEMNSKFLKTNV